MPAHRPPPRACQTWGTPSEASRASLLSAVLVHSPVHRSAPVHQAANGNTSVPVQHQYAVARERSSFATASNKPFGSSASRPAPLLSHTSSSRSLTSLTQTPSVSLLASVYSHSSGGHHKPFEQSAAWQAARAHSGYARRLEFIAPRRATRHVREPPTFRAHHISDSSDASDEVAEIMQESPWTPRLTHLRRSPSSPSPNGSRSSLGPSPSSESIFSASSSDATPVWPRHWNRDHQARSRHSSSMNPTERATKIAWIPIRPAPSLTTLR